MGKIPYICQRIYNYNVDMNNMNVTKNGFDTKLNNGTITLKKSMFGEGLDDLFLTFYVSSDGETNNWYLDSSDCFVIRKQN